MNQSKRDNWNAISIEQAFEYTARWQQQYPLNAFLFHKNELQCLQNENDSVGIRFYMGIKENDSVDMLAVGTNASYDDIINEEGSNSGVYNFPMPCPSTCDITSPLYHGFESSNMEKYSEKNKTDNFLIKSCIELLEEISLEQALKWTLNWQKLYSIKSFHFSIDQLNLAMLNEEVSRVRIYFGLNENDHIKTIMVGVDDNGKDIIRDTCQMSEVSPCGIGTVLIQECDESSPLYHTIELSIK